MRRSALAAVAAIGSASLLLAGCSKADDSECNDGNKSAGANAATKDVVNASDEEGRHGHLRDSDVPDSFDPGNTYYAFMYNFSRLYARPLITFKPGPGEKGNELVPDLAASRGQAQRRRQDLDVQAAQGPEVPGRHADHLARTSSTPSSAATSRVTCSRSARTTSSSSSRAATSTRVPTRTRARTGLKSIETPDDTTVVFHLKHAVPEFDYLVATPQTAPVPAGQGQGRRLRQAHRVLGLVQVPELRGGQAVRPGPQPELGPRRPTRCASSCPDKIVVNLKVNAGRRSTRTSWPATPDRPRPARVSQAADPGQGPDRRQAKKANTDNTYGGRLVYMAINTKVKPFDNIDCRKAVEYAIDKVSVQTAQGGPIRGDIASTVLPPDIHGYQKYDLYARRTRQQGRRRPRPRSS